MNDRDRTCSTSGLCQRAWVVGGLGLALLGAACNDAGGSSGQGGQSAVATGGAGGTSLSAQAPPQGTVAVEAWLATGAYKQWHCESAAHASRSPSPHGFNRICTNDVISSMLSGSGPWPKGAAAVKELFVNAGDVTPAGYSVYVKTESDSAGGANWYWYERLPSSSSPFADGKGDSGSAKSVCVGCHAAAGADAAHTPSLGGRDQVYTPVP